MATYQIQIEVSGKWLDCGEPIDDRTEAVAKYSERINRKTGDAFRLLKIEIVKPLFDSAD